VREMGIGENYERNITPIRSDVSVGRHKYSVGPAAVNANNKLRTVFPN